MRPVSDAVVLDVEALDGLCFMEHHVGRILLAWAFSWIMAMLGILTGNGFYVSRSKAVIFCICCGDLGSDNLTVYSV